MSKSSLHHDRDRIATNALRAIFPTYWLFKNPRDTDSGKEYSEDWIIEIVNDDERRTPTEIEFGVQNKTDANVRKRHVTVRLSVDDIQRLIDLQRPALIHAHDMDSKTSYWLWLNEWYAVHHQKLKGKKKEILVKIPKTNVLDGRSVEKIRAYASREHHKRKLQEAAETLARTRAKDYNVYTVLDDVSFTTVVEPKHDGAIPIIKALDQTASGAMMEAIETGKPTSLVGSIAISNFPELILVAYRAEPENPALDA